MGRPAWWLRDEMAAGRLPVRQVLEAHLDRLYEVEPWLSATVTINGDRALAEADRLQRDLADGMAPGPLFGVPFTVKDVIATAGVETTCGSQAFAGNVPLVDAVAVRRLRAAGGILLAKSNCPEFAFGVTTDSPLRASTRSPWGEHSPGGSSGGEAALVAAGASALGLGGDYGGSLRWPAQCCGVLALRPGIGSVDGTGQLPELGGRLDGGADGPSDSVQRHFQVVGPLARSVRDLDISYQVLSGQPVSGAVGLVGLRVGWLDDDPGQPVDREVSAVVRAAVGRLAERGILTEPVPDALAGLHEAFNALRATDPMTDLRAALDGRGGAVGPVARSILDTKPSSDDAESLWSALAALRERVRQQLGRTAVLVLPVAPAASCDLEGRASVNGQAVSGFALMAQCRAVSALGLPVLSIPIGLDAGGLPVSVQVVAGPGREDLVLHVGALLEQLGGGLQSPPWLP